MVASERQVAGKYRPQVLAGKRQKKECENRREQVWKYKRGWGPPSDLAASERKHLDGAQAVGGQQGLRSWAPAHRRDEGLIVLQEGARGGSTRWRSGGGTAYSHAAATFPPCPPHSKARRSTARAPPPQKDPHACRRHPGLQRW